MSLIAIEKAYQDDKASIEQALQKLFAPFGGVDEFLFPNARVLINVQPTVAPLLVEALEEALHKKGMQYTTINISAKDGGFSKIAVPQPLVMEEIEVRKEAAGADVIFNVASMAAVNRNAFTLCVYNLIQLLSEAAKLNFASTHSARALVDLYQTLMPQFNIVDYLIPEANTYEEHSFLMASYDAVALDSIAALYAGADLRDAEYLVLAHQYGLGVGNVEEISLTGNHEGIFAWE